MIPTLPAARALAAVLAALALAAPARATDAGADRNAALVRAAFDAWRDGRGSVFDLLADHVEWTVAGTGPVSATYRTRDAFMRDAVLPINARLATPIVPTVRDVLARDDAVLVVWDGTATARDGSAYRNSYAWLMTLDDGRVVRVTAFLDTWALERLMR